MEFKQIKAQHLRKKVYREFIELKPNDLPLFSEEYSAENMKVAFYLEF